MVKPSRSWDISARLTHAPVHGRKPTCAFSKSSADGLVRRLGLSPGGGALLCAGLSAGATSSPNLTDLGFTPEALLLLCLPACEAKNPTLAPS